MNLHEDRDTGQKVSMEEEKRAKEKDLDGTGNDGDGRRGRYRYEGTRGPSREGWAVATSLDVHEQRADAEETEVMHSSADADRQEVVRSSMERSGRVRVGILQFQTMLASERTHSHLHCGWRVHSEIFQRRSPGN